MGSLLQYRSDAAGKSEDFIASSKCYLGYSRIGKLVYAGEGGRFSSQAFRDRRVLSPPGQAQTHVDRFSPSQRDNCCEKIGSNPNDLFEAAQIHGPFLFSDAEVLQGSDLLWSIEFYSLRSR